MKKKASTIFLKVVILIIGIMALIGLIRFPMTEGRAVNLDLFSIYSDPFILYMFVASIPFFIGLYQAFKLLGYIGQNQVFSLSSVKCLRTIKYCAIAFALFIVLGEIWIILANDGSNDGAGSMAVGIVTIFSSIITATAAAVFEKLLQSAVDIKS